MYVQTTQAGCTTAGPFEANAVLEIPREYFDPTTMTRLGPNLSAVQLGVLVTWASVCPGSPAINAE
jgi:hypothetical protein